MMFNKQAMPTFLMLISLLINQQLFSMDEQFTNLEPLCQLEPSKTTSPPTGAPNEILAQIDEFHDFKPSPQSISNIDQLDDKFLKKQQILEGIKKAALPTLRLESLTMLLFLAYYSLHTQQTPGSTLVTWFKEQKFTKTFHYFALALITFQCSLHNASFDEECRLLITLHLNMYLFLAESFTTPPFFSPDDEAAQTFFLKRLAKNIMKSAIFLIPTEKTPLKTIRRLCTINKSLLEQTGWYIPLVTERNGIPPKNIRSLRHFINKHFQDHAAINETFVNNIIDINKKFDEWLKNPRRHNFNDFQSLYESIQELAFFM